MQCLKRNRQLHGGCKQNSQQEILEVTGRGHFFVDEAASNVSHVELRGILTVPCRSVHAVYIPFRCPSGR